MGDRHLYRPPNGNVDHAQALANQFVRASLSPSHADRKLYSWFNVSGQPDNWNGTDVEGDKSLAYGDFFYQQIVANNIAVAALTLFVWEYISTFVDEINLYRRRKFFSPHVILFVLIRYGTLPALVLPAYSVWHDFSEDPDGCLQHQQLTSAAVQLIVAIIFAWRTIAIWSKDRIIVGFLSFLVIAQFSTSFALLWYSEERLLPNGACMPVPSRSGFNSLPWFYLTAMLYDAITIGLSSYKLWQYSSLGRPEELRPKKSEFLRAPLRTARKIKDQWSSLTPLLERLLSSGLLYFIVATAFNACNFALEIRQDLHAKSLVALYAPLMCILCQRIILLDVKALWGSGRGDTGSREQSLVDRVMRERRRSWEGDDAEVFPPAMRTIPSRSPTSEKTYADQMHTAVKMDGSDTQEGGFTFKGMLANSPSEEETSRRRGWKDMLTMGKRSGEGLDTDGRSRGESNSATERSSSGSGEISPRHHQSAPSSSSSSNAPVQMTDAQRSQALRMAGLDQSLPQ